MMTATMVRYRNERGEVREAPPSDPVTTAATAYLALRDRDEHPDGSFDRKKRWYPAELERRPCCSEIRSPSAGCPYSLMTHCRTAKHVAARFGVPEADLRRRARELEKEAKTAITEGAICYKVVEMVDGQYRSFYGEGATRLIYEIGVTKTQPAKANHGGGYYVFRSEWDAIQHYNGFPGQEKALLAVRIGPGPVVCYGSVSSKVAVSELTPIEEIGREFTRVREEVSDAEKVSNG